MKKNKGCPVCQSSDGTTVHEKKKENVSWIHCTKCGMVYKSSKKAAVDTDAAYYRAGQMRGTVPYRYGDAASVTPEIAYEEKQELQWERYLKLRKHIHTKTSVLEIGCGSGGFLHILKPMASQCVGIELDKEQVDFCKSRLKLDVRDTLLQETKFNGKKFDLICMFHVLEHFRDPKSFLKEVKKHLHSEGRLAIEVPCFNEALLQVFNLKKYRELYFTIHHELFFTLESLGRLLSDCGFRVDFSPFNEYGIANHLNWVQNDSPVLGASRQSGRCLQIPKNGKPKSHSDFIDDLNLLVRQVNEEYKELLASHGMFDTIFCVAEKV